MKKKRIVNSYNKGWIEEYEAEIEIDRINCDLKKLKSNTSEKEYIRLKNLSTMKWLDVYNELSRENKQLFFREFIDKVSVDVERYRECFDDFLTITLVK